MPRRLALFRLVLATVSAASIFSTTTSVAGTSETELCFGQVPTIVGTPDMGSIEGTDGPDVVVTNGSATVNTWEGDDLVCITGKAALHPGEAMLGDTGPGNDAVDASRNESEFAETILGGGADEYVGGPGDERVIAGDPYDPAPEGDVDVITTAAGSDQVFAGNGGDIVDLGRGADFLDLSGVSGVAALDGGGGEDTLFITFPYGAGKHTWTLDTGAGRMLRDGNLTASSLDGFARFSLTVLGPIRFLGSGEDESLVFQADPGRSGESLAQAWPVEARMRGGDDVITFYGGAPASRFDGGSGTDMLDCSRALGLDSVASVKVLLDLARGIQRDTGPEQMTSRRAVGLEDASVLHANGVTILKGTAGPNRLSSGGSLIYEGIPLEDTYAVIDGRAGDDNLSGGDGDDVLIGGAGHDDAKGRHGFDRCKAETRLGCEA